MTPHGACLSSVYCFQACVFSAGVCIVCYCFPACVSPVYCMLSCLSAVHWTMRMLIVRLSEHTGYSGAAVRECIRRRMVCVCRLFVDTVCVYRVFDVCHHVYRSFVGRCVCWSSIHRTIRCVDRRLSERLGGSGWGGGPRARMTPRSACLSSVYHIIIVCVSYHYRLFIISLSSVYRKLRLFIVWPLSIVVGHPFIVHRRVDRPFI
jgi:hypothetical protein